MIGWALQYEYFDYGTPENTLVRHGSLGLYSLPSLFHHLINALLHACILAIASAQTEESQVKNIQYSGVLFYQWAPERARLRYEFRLCVSMPYV